MRKFGVMGPARDKIILHEGATLDEVQKKLLIGYTVVNELVDGVVVPPLPDGLKRYTFMTSLLINHGLELREWLAENGCVCKCGEPRGEPARRPGGHKDGKAVTHEAQD